MRHLLPVLLIAAASSLAGAATLRTTDGLTLELADDGQVAGLSLQGRALPVAAGGGFYVRDVAAAGERRRLRCPLLPDGGMWIQKQRFDDLGLTLETSCAGAGEYLSFSVKLTDDTGRDRAVEAGFELPFDGNGWTWADDLSTSHKIVAGMSCRNTVPGAAGPGYLQLVPFTTLSRGSAGLSLGLPLSQGPRVFAVEYDGSIPTLVLRCHLGLSPKVQKLPGQAWFSLLLCAHDGLWGMRSAAAKYQRLFPRDFTKRVPYEGGLGALQGETDDEAPAPPALYGVPALGDFGRWFRHAGQSGGEEDSKGLLRTLANLDKREPRREPYTWCLSVAGADPARAPDATPEALATAEAPLTYDQATHAVGALDSAWRREAKVLAPLAAQHQLLVSHVFAGGTPGLAADWPLLDVGVVDYTSPEAADALFRLAAATRPLRYRHGPAGEEAVRKMLQRGLLYAIFPDLPPDVAPYRDLYQRFVPVIQRLSAAGWQPVTLARSAAPELQIERYGSVGEGTLCLALRNAGTEPLVANVLLDPALGLPTAPAQARATDLVADAPVPLGREPNGLSLPVHLQPGEATAVAVLPTARYLQRALLQAAGALDEATALDPEEITTQTTRPGELLAGDTPGARAATVLADGWTGNQGLVFGAREALTIGLDLNSPHRVRWLRVHYGLGDGLAAPEATVEAADREGTWRKLGTVAAGSAASPAPLVEVADTGEYQRLRLVYPELPAKLWVREIEVVGRDGALMRAAERFRALAASGCHDFGVISQLAMVLRVRRMLGHDRTLQERALTHLADFCRVTSGISARVELPADAAPAGAARAQLVVSNSGGHALQEGSVKLKLPPGWSAAPAKFAASVQAGETVRLPVTISRPPGGGRLTLLLTGVVDGVPLFVSRQD